MRKVLAFLCIVLAATTAGASHLWVNNINVNEYNMTWGYTETFTGAASIAYRTGIDIEFGNNDSFVSAWELLNADKELRKGLRKSIDSEPDVKINNGTGGIEVADIDSKLSPDAIGNTNLVDPIVNRYNVTYRFKDSILNASSIWFLGEPQIRVTVILPPGIDIVNISGMDNVTKSVTDHTEITGFFKTVTLERGEISLDLARNTSVRASATNVSPPVISDNTTAGNVTKPMAELLSGIRNISILGIGIAIIILIYVFRIKKR